MVNKSIEDQNRTFLGKSKKSEVDPLTPLTEHWDNCSIFLNFDVAP